MGYEHASDIGHGMSNSKPGLYDPGAVSPKRPQLNDLIHTEEHKINVVMSAHYCDHIRALGRTAVEISGKLTERAGKAKTAGAKSLVSWHTDSNTKPDPAGFCLWVHPSRSDSMALAKAIEAELKSSKVLEKYGRRYRGIRTINKYIVRAPQMPCVLIENGFVSNPGDERVMNNADYQNDLSRVVAIAVLKHFGQYSAKAIDNRLYYVTIPSGPNNYKKVELEVLTALKALKYPLYKLHVTSEGKLQAIATAKSRDHLIQAVMKAGYKHPHIQEKV